MKSLSNQTNSDPNLRNKTIFLCSLFGIFLNFLSFLLKFFVGFLSGSIAIQTDSFNNLSDAASSGISMIGIKLSSKKADYDHPFGHGRIEYLSGIAVSVLILLMGFSMLKESVLKFFNPSLPDRSYLISTLIALFLSVGIKLLLWYYNRRYAKKTNSSVLKAVSQDSLYDSCATLSVIFCTIISHLTKIPYFDPFFGFMISFLILRAGYFSIKETTLPILGKMPSKEFTDAVEKIVLNHEEFFGIHDLIVHDYGPGRVIVSLHAEVSSNASITEIHDVIDNTENELSEKLFCEAVIHCDPIEVDNPEIDQYKTALNEILSEISDLISIHDFRVVKGKTHTNLLFDLSIPFGFRDDPNILCATVRKEVLKRYPNHYCIIKIEHNLSK